MGRAPNQAMSSSDSNSMSRPSIHVPSGIRWYRRSRPTSLNPTFSYARIARDVVRRRIDREPVVPIVIDQSARERPDRRRSDAMTLGVLVQEQVDPRVAEFRVCLLVGLDGPDEATVDLDREHAQVGLAHDQLLFDAVLVEIAPPSGHRRLGKDRGQGGRVLGKDRPDGDVGCCNAHGEGGYRVVARLASGPTDVRCSPRNGPSTNERDRRAPGRRSRRRDGPFSAIVRMRHRSAATAPVERLDKRTLPVRRPDHHTAPARYRRVERRTQGSLRRLRSPAARQKARRNTRMMSRNATASYAGRASSMRRLRRRSSTAHASGRPFCRTNGCPSFLEIDPVTGIATCPVCGSTQRQRARAQAH